MKKKLIMISLSIMLIVLLSVNVKSYNDYEGNHDDLECHGIETETESNDKTEIKEVNLNFAIISIIGLLFSISLSVSFIYWFYTQR